MIELATTIALAVAHAFIVFLADGYPVNVLNQLKQVPEVVQPDDGRPVRGLDRAGELRAVRLGFEKAFTRCGRAWSTSSPWPSTTT